MINSSKKFDTPTADTSATAAISAAATPSSGQSPDGVRAPGRTGGGTMIMQSGLIFAALTVLTGVVYPLAITAIAQVVCPVQAGGSLVKDRSGHLIGSALLGQTFSSDRYFSGRPSATTVPYDAAASSGSNLAASNQAFIDTVKKRTAECQKRDGIAAAVPVDLVTASGSGLDPDISPQAAYLQAARIAATRHMSESQVKSMIARHIEPRQFGILGEPRVNVLKLNLALDDLDANAR